MAKRMTLAELLTLRQAEVAAKKIKTTSLLEAA